MTMVEEIANAIDNDLHTVGIFIDLSKAFDTIDHNYLLEKMEHYGFRGTVHAWLKSYLENSNMFK